MPARQAEPRSDKEPTYDVTAQADHLDLDGFAVSGASFGGPYAMACAYKIPERLTEVGLISSFAPYDQPGTSKGRAPTIRFALGAARRAMWLGKLCMGLKARTVVHAEPGMNL